MAYDTETIHHRLMRQSNYLARPGFSNSVGWTSSGNGQLLVNSRSLDEKNQDPYKPATCTVVGNIEKERLNASPTGNHNPQYKRLFSAAKFQMTVSCPRNEGDLRKDWVTAISVLKKLQSAVGKTSNYRYLIEDDKRLPSIRLSASIFKKQDSAFDVLSDDSEPMEFHTRDWPVPASHADVLQEIADTHRVLPLVAYDETEALILPENMQSTLAGALVEITFSLRHYLMGKGNEEKFDCFSGRIEQIVVIRPPGPPLPSPFQNFKRKSPWRPTDEEPINRYTKRTRRAHASQPEYKSQDGCKETEQDDNSSDKDVFEDALHGDEAAPTHSGCHPYTNLRPISKIATSTNSRKTDASPTPGPSRFGSAKINNKKDFDVCKISDGESFDGYSVVAATLPPIGIAIEGDHPDEPTINSAITEETGTGATLADNPPRKRTRTTKGKAKAH
ncbi:hypothetical protein NP233_g8151 [Leucocoprinus birnbaumii]|uniref:Uncharacterized protein n=1 Tax=Leucocoprinus birnbaumii TaxID=56174 RepID=A0AAD5YU38_9AGAR|nr:hypothetical protein NP233_g8151 [Leucocoprinus birnbaumii]